MASRVDWNEVILGLRRMGFGITSIAAAIGVSKSNLCAWGRGVEPTFSRGRPWWTSGARSRSNHERIFLS